jgi:hypothetical protein
VEIGVLALGDPRKITCEKEANAFAQAVEEVFKVTIKGVGQLDKGEGRPATWWTQEYKDAYKVYINTRQLYDSLTLEKKHFLTIV